MPRAPRKSDLPVKICATCGRPMAWRRKWARVWEEVRHCSEKCRRARKMTDRDAAGSIGPVGSDR
ncbi:MAG: DUF2256 domain-containing protein [Rhodobacteraceae bacterium CG17_big_fil_post_rev_8_21_14_2_50_63_15]|nr:DUF2256 domain-containing protein [Roseovarius sp.]PIV79964.1 MAG: DUF2256 domain-containing protein [Rhodobacteraceae bacterium CG17_big_fil_post_rev_8_21_14_2_50_63_15]